MLSEYEPSLMMLNHYLPSLLFPHNEIKNLYIATEVEARCLYARMVCYDDLFRGFAPQLSIYINLFIWYAVLLTVVKDTGSHRTTKMHPAAGKPDQAQCKMTDMSNGIRS